MFRLSTCNTPKAATANRTTVLSRVAQVATIALAFTTLASAQVSSSKSYSSAESYSSSKSYSSEEYPTQRIVDPQTVRRQSSAPLRFALAPLSAAGAKFESGLNFVEDTKIHNRLQIMLADPHIRPTIGTLGDGSGFGLGFAFNTAGLDERKRAIEGDFHVTAKQYVEARVAARLLTRDTRAGLLTVRTGVGYRMRPEEDFFGLGPSSDFRTNYNLIERSTSATVELKRGKRLRYGTEFKYSDKKNLTEADSRWAAEIIGSFTDEQIRAAVETGELSDANAADYLAEQIIARRDLIVATYLESSSADRTQVASSRAREFAGR